MITISLDSGCGFAGQKKCFEDFTKLLQLKYYDDIIEMDCSHNNLTTLPTLPLGLKTLKCNNNNLYILPELPYSLEYLNCSNNKLVELPKLSTYLIWLYTEENNLIKLPPLTKYIRIIYCNNNKLTNLPNLPKDLKYLYCQDNNLDNLPTLPDDLHYLYYENNPIYSFIETYFEGSKLMYFEWMEVYKKKYANTLGDWFLECKYNPKYKYCRDRVNADYDSLINTI